MREELGQRWYTMQLNSIEVLPNNNANGFFSLIGVGRVLVDSMVDETVQGKPGWHNISFNLVQNDLDITEYERLIQSNSIDYPAYQKLLES